MLSMKLPFVLASGSPRRKELLDLLGIPYTIDVSDIDESFCGEPEETVCELSYRKAKAVAERHPNSLILGADTLVFCGEVLGKPHTPERAKTMLQMLSDHWHTVYSGLTLIHTQSGRVLHGAQATRVHFVKMTQEEIDAYVATGEPLDKAGAYGIQGCGGIFIDRIEGSYSNVVGLPMSLLRSMIYEMGNV